MVYRREDAQDSSGENSEELMALASDSEADGDYSKLIENGGDGFKACVSEMSEEDMVSTPAKPRARRAK